MPISIEIGGTCRDINLLPQDEGELKVFFDRMIAPAFWEDFSKNLRMARGTGADGSRNFNAELDQRGCEIGGKIVISL